jgi:signal transduction histidine kinase/CheY-like chemotaxis protein
MNVIAVLPLIAVPVALYVAALSRRFSLAPGWRDQRCFAWVALTVAGYSALNIPTTLALSDAAVVLTSRLQAILAALHVIAWLRYSRVHLGLPASRSEKALIAALAAVGLVAGVTPLVYPGGSSLLHVPLFGLTYRNPVTSPAGEVVLACVIGSLAVPAARFFAAWRRGVPYAGVHVAALAILFAMAVNDELVMAGAYPMAYLLDLGFLAPIAAVAYALTSRFAADAADLQALRQDLELQVAERTGDLVRTQAALHRAEKLAALGQFAAGVAHEVNNPAAVVSANLQYLSENEGEDLSESGREALRDSITSIRRIATIVRQLLDAGRLAACAERTESVAVRAAVDAGLRIALPRFPRRCLAVNEVPEGLFALGQETLLVQVIVNLLVNAAQAIPEGHQGVVRVSGERLEDRVRIAVEDNGAGMAPDVLRRVFEPFFTTKPFGTGTGLGLAVSRGLLAGIGGELRLESQVGAGTRALVELGCADTPPQAAARAGPATAAPEGTPRRRRLLLVDDDPAVLTSLARALERRYEVAVADGVAPALARLTSDRFDAVLCDVMMPDGGGERVYRTLEAQAPEMARRLIFVTGGAATASARHFLDDQPQPVLHKPLDLASLGAAIEHLCHDAPAKRRVLHALR